jgi:hypothetical protein
MTIRITPNDKGNPPGKLAEAEKVARPLRRSKLVERASEIAEWIEHVFAS